MFWLACVPPPTPVARPSRSPEAAPAAGAPDWVALACWAGGYTPRVSLAGGVLRAELAGSLRLFGGAVALVARLRGELGELAPTLHLATAATPRAAWWLARAGSTALCADEAATRAALRELPLAALAIDAELMQRLAGFGFGTLDTLGPLLDLPRAALAARTGAGFVLDMARALGEVAEPLPWFAFPETFSARLELPAPVEAAPALLFAARRLLTPLSGWLAARSAALRYLEWRIGHGPRRVTTLPLRFSRPVHAPAGIERVLQQALERLRLPQPALELGLEVPRYEPRDAASGALFDQATADGEHAYADLLDRLAARLGEAAVVGLDRLDDHRPEAATRCTSLLAKGQKVGAGGTGRSRRNTVAAGHATPSTLPPRPLWLYEPPRPLRERNGRPCAAEDGTPLVLVTGPERIESGWWDGADVRRDYFVALDARQRWLWIFRDRQAAGWYLHGLMA